ncbi:MAG: TRAP transporter substrate-binding protein [Planctomycetes bacterium]|nr:TRAP transporter substrate-binding protein [Planctomycetota bacterium]
MSGRSKRWVPALAVLMTLAAALGGCGGDGDETQAPEGVSTAPGDQAPAQAPAPARTIKLAYSVFFPPTHVQTLAAQAWADEIRTRTGGQVQITLYPGNTLSTPDQIYRGVVNGEFDLGMSCFAYTRGDFPLLEALDLPLGYPDGMTATRLATKMVRKYQPAELAEVHTLLVHAHGPGLLASKKPVRSLDDLRGLKVRATGLSQKLVAALGGTPVAMDQSETAEALRKGTVEATFCPIETLEGWSQGQAIQYITDTSAIGYTTAMFVVMNKEVWDGLPQEIQAVFNEVTDAWIERHGQAWDDADASGRDFVAKLDPAREIIALSAEEQARWTEAVRPVLDAYVAAAAAKGLPGDKLLADLQAELAAIRAGGE